MRTFYVNFTKKLREKSRIKRQKFSLRKLWISTDFFKKRRKFALRKLWILNFFCKKRKKFPLRKLWIANDFCTKRKKLALRKLWILNGFCTKHKKCAARKLWIGTIIAQNARNSHQNSVAKKDCREVFFFAKVGTVIILTQI